MNMNMDIEMDLNGASEQVTKVQEKFSKVFGDSSNSQLILSPASLILLGDHTHYNEGILISSAINSYYVIQIKKRNDRIINLANADDDEEKVKSFSLTEIPGVTENGFRTVTCLIKKLYHERMINSGFDCMFSSSIPECIGLGITAALEIGFVSAIKKIFKLSAEMKNLFQIVRSNDLEIIGKITNMAHYFTIKYNKEGRLVFTDLRTMDYKTLQMPGSNLDIVVCDTQEEIINPRNTCNERITECEVGVKGLRLYIWGIKNLRDVELEFLLRHFHMLPKKIFSRVLYNVKERMRAEDALKHIKQKSLANFGKCITESHWNLSEDYEISCDKCDFVVKQAQTINGVYGSKMISCSSIKSTFHLVEKSVSDNFIENIRYLYKEKYGTELLAYKFNLTPGVKEISLKKLQLA